MQFEIDDYILGVWQADGLDSNFLMFVKQDKESNSWIGEYRFRYFKDEKIFDSEDDKSRTVFKAKNKSEAEMLGSVNALFLVIQMKYPINPNFTLVQGDFKKMLKLICEFPWFNCKVKDKDGNETKIMPENIEELLSNENNKI